MSCDALEQRLLTLEQPNIPCTELVDVLNELAHALIDVDPQRAQTLVHRAQWLAAQLKYPQGEVRSLTLLSWLHLLAGHPDRALVRALHAEAIARRVKDDRLESRALYMSALVHDHVGHFEEAIKARHRMIGIARELNDAILEANCLMAMGAQHTKRHAPQQALDCYEAALKLYESRDPIQANAARNNIATALIDLGRADEGLLMAETALLSCDPKNLRHYTWILHSIGCARAAMQEHDLAVGQFATALFMIDQADRVGQAIDKAFQVTLLLDLAKAYAALSQTAMAFSSLERALQIGTAIDAKPILIEVHHLLCQLYQAQRSPGLALVHAEQREALKAISRHTQSDQFDRVIKVMAVVRAARDRIQQANVDAVMQHAWMMCLRAPHDLPHTNNLL
jgi:tetratricopeptide (TPR) repeat protein